MDVFPLRHRTAIGLHEREDEPTRETKVCIFLCSFLWKLHSTMQIVMWDQNLSSAKLRWLFYFFRTCSMVEGRVREAVRASKSYSSDQKPVYVYLRYLYVDRKSFLSEVYTQQKLLITLLEHFFPDH
jgi:hypothetical protein